MVTTETPIEDEILETSVVLLRKYSKEMKMSQHDDASC